MYQKIGFFFNQGYIGLIFFVKDIGLLPVRV